MTKRKDAHHPIDDIELEGIAREFIRSSLGGPDTELAGIRERNLRAYNATPDGEFAAPDIDDRSTFVSSDVADTVDGMMPQLLDVFVSDDKAVECKPKKPGEKAAAQARDATGYLNHLFYVRNDGLNVLHDWFQDAALQKVGFVKVWAEENQEDTKQTYDGQTQEQLAALLMDGAQLAGEPAVDEQGGLTFTVVDESKRMQFHVACVAPYEMRIDSNAKWGDDPAAIGQVCYRRRFELEEMGYDLENVGGGGLVPNGEQRALLGDAQDEIDTQLHDSHKLYEYAELYFKLDVDGDGIAEWVQVCLINGTLVSHEQVDDHPFADICFMPRAHAYFGDCPADRAFLIQKEQTNLARALFDNTYFSTNQRHYINTSAEVNIADVLDNRPGGIVRGVGPMSEAFGQIPTYPIPQTAWQMQEWLSVKLENRTGFTRYSQGMDSKSLNDTAHGIDIITSKSDMRLRLMTRHAALGVRKMMGKLLKLSTQHQKVQDWFAVNGEFVAVNPSEWRDQFTMSINVGLGHGTREQKMAAVMAMLPMQQMGLQLGIVRPEHIAKTIRLAAQVNEFKNVDDFCDEQPQGPPMQQLQQQMQDMHGQLQQAQQQGQQLAQENAQLKLANANKQGEMQLRAAELQSKHAIATQPDAIQEPDGNSLEWAKVEIARYEAETARMALGYNAEQAAAQFALDQAQAQHDAMMAEAAHEQQGEQYARQAAEPTE